MEFELPPLSQGAIGLCIFKKGVIGLSIFQKTKLSRDKLLKRSFSKKSHIIPTMDDNLASIIIAVSMMKSRKSPRNIRRRIAELCPRNAHLNDFWGRKENPDGYGSLHSTNRHSRHWSIYENGVFLSEHPRRQPKLATGWSDTGRVQYYGVGLVMRVQALILRAFKKRVVFFNAVHFCKFERGHRHRSERLLKMRRENC